ncbi:unnamed protein product, partial [Rotaria magnacalcarata]
LLMISIFGRNDFDFWS